MSAADRARAVETGRSTASSSRSHSSAAGVAKTLPAPLMTAGTPARSSASSTSAASLFVGTSTATWPRPDRLPAASEPSAARATSVADDDRTRTTSAARSSAITASAAGFDAYPFGVSGTSASARCRTRTRSGAVDGRVEQPRLAVRVGRADGPVDDALVAELGAAEERVEGVDQALVAAPVRRQRRLGDGAVGGAEVGVDVGAAEGVDRLLRVADQDQRRLSSPKARRMISHWIGSVSWNSSTSTTR